METNFSPAGATGTTGNGSDTATTARSAYGEAKSRTKQSAADLRNDLTNLKNDLDALVNRAPTLSDEELQQAHARLMAQFSSLRYAAKGFAGQASRQLNRGVETTTEYVKGKPMQSVAVAIGTGLLLGMLLKRR